jgi:hypothetical protein
VLNSAVALPKSWARFSLSQRERAGVRENTSPCQMAAESLKPLQPSSKSLQDLAMAEMSVFWTLHPSATAILAFKKALHILTMAI